MKACSKCGVVKAPDAFHRMAKVKSGRRADCKACVAAATKAHRAAIAPLMKERRARNWKANRDALAAVNAKWHAENRDRAAQRKAAARAASPAEYRARDAAWRKANPHKVAARAAKRRAVSLRATPDWANLELVAAFYTLAEIMTKATGVPHHVDHIEPLQGKHVCGLHNEFNLQVLPAAVNLAKSNKAIDVVGLR